MRPLGFIYVIALLFAAVGRFFINLLLTTDIQLEYL